MEQLQISEDNYMLSFKPIYPHTKKCFYWHFWGLCECTACWNMMTTEEREQYFQVLDAFYWHCLWWYLDIASRRRSQNVEAGHLNLDLISSPIFRPTLSLDFRTMVVGGWAEWVAGVKYIVGGNQTFDGNKFVLYKEVEL